MADAAHVKRGSDVVDGETAQYGGKSVNLAILQRLGQPVPPWYAVSTAAFVRTLTATDLSARIRQRLAVLTDASDGLLRTTAAQIREWITAAPIGDDLRDAIMSMHRAIIPAGGAVAVRSSAVDEDGGNKSFAGLHDSMLYIRELRDVLFAVRQVWASAFTERALSYRLQRGIRLDDIRIAVIVQQMVAPRSSGVVFTMNPSTGNPHQIVIASLFGTGEGLVSAGLPADSYTVDKHTLAVTSEIADKTQRMVYDEGVGKGVKLRHLDRALQQRSSLTAEEVRVLAKAGMAIEAHYGRPQDIEFAVQEDHGIYMLQTRPVTTAGDYGPAAGNRIIWDNSNIIESYSGVTSPMTFSFIRRAYTIVYHCFAEVMGIPDRVVRDNRRVFANMLGLFRGQVYYNLVNWYRLVGLFPGFRFNKAFMESMMGLKETVDFNETAVTPGFLRRYLVDLPSLLRLLARSMWHFARIRRRTADFDAHFRRHYTRWSELDLDRLRPHQLMRLYEEMEDRLLWNWKAPIVNDFFVMIFYGALKKLCAAWCGDETGSLQNDLICGEGGIESTEPAKQLIALAHRARGDEALRAFLTETPAESVLSTLEQTGRFPAFTSAVHEYLQRYGFRCMNELKLEVHSLRDRPEGIFHMLRNYLAVNDAETLDVAAMEAREQNIRQAAETRARQALRRGWAALPRQLVFRWILNGARLGVKNRENMRFARTRIYGLLREVIRAIGRRFAEEEILDNAEDIFSLTLDEVWDFVKGTAVTTRLKDLAALRAEEFHAHREAEPPDDHFETYGSACHRNLYRNWVTPSEPCPADGELRGTSCCPGTVTGSVAVLRTPRTDADVAGRILVAARTDPGWVPLYPAVTGLLVERGSILSHSAIVAREMGIPTIVGIPGLCEALTDGQVVRMDGAAGTVQRVTGAAPSQAASRESATAE